ASATGGLEQFRDQIRTAQIIAQLNASLSRRPTHSGSIVEHKIGRVQHIPIVRLRRCDIKCVGVDEAYRVAAPITGAYQTLEQPNGVLLRHVANTYAEHRHKP